MPALDMSAFDKSAAFHPTPVHRNPSLAFTSALATAALCAGFVALAGPAAAVSASVRNACMSDYFAYCSQHDVGSTGLRRCMQSAGPKLSKPCVSALVSSGEVKQAANDRRSSKSRKRA